MVGNKHTVRYVDSEKQKMKLDDSGNTNPNNTRWKKKIRKNNYEKQLKLEISAI